MQTMPSDRIAQPQMQPNPQLQAQSAAQTAAQTAAQAQAYATQMAQYMATAGVPVSPEALRYVCLCANEFFFSLCDELILCPCVMCCVLRCGVK
jgi:hypothetical protein